MNEPDHLLESEAPERTLRAYSLGSLPFEELLALQRRLVYEIGGERTSGALVVCDHPPGITIGRAGSRLDVRPGPERLNSLGWKIRWLSRGGGTMLHLPGQVACYPILALDACGGSLADYVAALQAIVVEALAECDLAGTPDPQRPGVRVNGRRLAHIGIAVRGNVACFGLVINVDPDLEPFRDVRCDGDPIPMTSIQREASGRIRVSSVRRLLAERIAGRFGFTRVSVFHNLPGARPRPNRYATA